MAEVEMEAKEVAVSEAERIRNNNRILDMVYSASNEAETPLALLFRFVTTVFAYFLLCIPFSWFWCIQILPQYKRAIIFRLGKAQRRPMGPGLFLILPFLDEIQTVDLRVMSYAVPPQQVLTKDSVTLTIDAVVYYYVNDALKSILCAADYLDSTRLLSQTTLRAVVGQFDLDEIMRHRENIAKRISDILDDATDPWGVQVTSVQIKDLRLPYDMQRAMGYQAEAERDTRGKIISAEGEVQAAQNLVTAAENLTKNNTTMQLRYLQTLNDVSRSQTSTVVFPLPLSLISLVDSTVESTVRAVEELATSTEA